jgi:flagellin-like protein
MRKLLLTTDRGMSPVIGVVLLVAITGVLGATAATMVFGQSGVTVPPQGDLSFSYTEEYGASETDSFGRTGDAGGDGQTTIVVETVSKDIEAEQLAVIVGDSRINWAHNQTEYEVGDSIDSGDEVSVWTERGDEIMIVWEGSTQSAVLGRLSVPEYESTADSPDPDSNGESEDDSPFPSPDEDCSWVENQLGPPPYEGDLTIDGIIVECDLDQYNVKKLEIVNDGGVIGETEADGDIDMRDGTTWDGSVVMLSSGNDIDLDDGSKINGNVDASGNVALDAGSEVSGDVDATGDVDVDGNSQIGGGIDATGDVNLNEKGTGSVTVGDTLEAGGDVDIYDGSTVQGDVESTTGGSVTLTDSTVLGAVATGGNVDVDDSTVETHIYQNNGLSCDSSVINGDNCGDYTSKSYDEY